MLDLTAVDTGSRPPAWACWSALRVGNGQLLPGRRHYNVARLLHITGLNKVLPLYPEGASALEL